MEEAEKTVPKVKSPTSITHNINVKNSITCEDVPESLFDASSVKKHFSKFGTVQKIRLLPKRKMCIVEYADSAAVDKAILNAGAFDGFVFDVSRTKRKERRRSKKDDDPDWVPDLDIEEELNAMGRIPQYRVSRQKPMELDRAISPVRMAKQVVVRKKTVPPAKQSPVFQPVSESASTSVSTSTRLLSSSEAATELAQLAARVCSSCDEQWRALDARDRILRSWGGAGSRVRAGGATIGTCADMCPEKERLHRQAEHQVMNLEAIPDSDGCMQEWRAVKQYSRSSADQEIPMCYELRPAATLRRTAAYLLHEVADTTRQISLADWFHFLWDRFRGIRKDITQQALCCADSIQLLEMCARFHAHCAARLADLEHTQFDQKLNTDNLTKCLQSLKHMYADVGPACKPREAEFRGYIALLNLGDSNFWWEIKQLPQEIQKSEAISFAIKIFNALDNNNYVRFFRLVKEKATYLQACILLRYFNDVRARALARIVKAFAPRGGSRYPAQELMNSLAFENVESMKSFVNHYGLRIGVVDDGELSVILDRNQFIEDSDPYPIARALHLIESKRNCTVGEIIAGGKLPDIDYSSHKLYSSFNANGTMRLEALLAEDQGYNTLNDTNKNVANLKAELQRLMQGKGLETRTNVFIKSDAKPFAVKMPPKVISNEYSVPAAAKFSFKPAIPVAPKELIKSSPEKIFSNTTNLFSFSKPQEPVASSLWSSSNTDKASNENKDPFQNTKYVQDNNIFKSSVPKVFGQNATENKDPRSVFKSPVNVFGNATQKIFAQKVDPAAKEMTKSIFGSKTQNNNNIFAKGDVANFGTKGNIFAKSIQDERGEHSNIFSKPLNQGEQKDPKAVFGTFKSTATTNGESDLSPRSLFKSVNKPGEISSAGYSIFQTKNKAPQTTVAGNIFNSVHVQPQLVQQNDNYSFDETDDAANEERERIQKEKEAEKRRQEEIRKKEEIMLEMKRREEEKRLEAAREHEEKRKLEEKRRKEEEMKQEALKKKLDAERKMAELRKKLEEDERCLKERVDKESSELIEELINELNRETVFQLLKEEIECFNNLMSFAETTSDTILIEMCNSICEAEMKAEKFWTEKLMKKWFIVWRRQLIRNIKRRSLLHDTPVWLADQSPSDKASLLRRFVEKNALENMNAFHRGYRFTGELNLPPLPQPYNMMELIKSPLLKRMKQIHYPYDKCFFWKVTLFSPGAMKYVYKKIEVEKWLVDSFADKRDHEVSDSLIHVGKYSWNNLMDFAISVSLASRDDKLKTSEALEGSNGLLFYATENDNLTESLNDAIKQKYPYQILPVAVIIPNTDETERKHLETLLSDLTNCRVISKFKIFLLDPEKIAESLNSLTKCAVKWLAKNYPSSPPLEIDHLKSLCQRYLGNEIWYKLKLERETRLKDILKDLYKLVELYNIAVDKLTSVITNEDLFNYPTFPLEFKQYLDHNTPYPKPYEFISCNVKTSENVSAIKDIMRQLKLPPPQMIFSPLSVTNMQEDVKTYCKQIGWFENPEEVACKVVAVMPDEICDSTLSPEQFKTFYEQYDLVDLLNIVVYEKINSLNHFNNRFAIYEKLELNNYSDGCWWYETDIVANIKHEAISSDDDIDYMIKAKRRKLDDSFDYLMLEEKDITLVEDNIKDADEKMVEISKCTEAVKQLEQQLEEERKKSVELENILKAALSGMEY